MATLRLDLPVEQIGDPVDERVAACAREDMRRFDQLGPHPRLGRLLSYDPAHSLLAVYLVGLDAQVQLSSRSLELGACLLDERIDLDAVPGKVVTSGRIQGFVASASTDGEWPAIILAMAKWPSGRTRVALGGFGKTPVLAMDGTEAAGAAEAVRNALGAASDERASAEWRLTQAQVLLIRGLALA
jgi:CO/xanthine dehydrogenase FAD-binding subunit